MAAWSGYAVMALFLSVVQAIDHNRHAVLMTLLDAYPLVQVCWGYGSYLQTAGVPQAATSALGTRL